LGKLCVEDGKAKDRSRAGYLDADILQFKL